MDNQIIEYRPIEKSFNNELLVAIKNFVNDLSEVTSNKNFESYRTIVNRIDESKVKSYFKLVDGFTSFFNSNIAALNEGNLDGLKDPNISYVTESGSFSFNFQSTFQEAEEADQDTIKDHLNHILNILNNKGPEELYIDKIFKYLKKRISPELPRENHIKIAEELYNDFKKQNLDISVVVKVACKKAKELLCSNGSEDHTTLKLINDVEEIDVNNFDISQVMKLVVDASMLFSDEENNPLSLLTNILAPSKY